MVESKSLSINYEVCRITKAGDRYYFLVTNDECLREVSYSEFREFLKEISYVCITSWNRDLTNRYIQFVKYFHSIK